MDWYYIFLILLVIAGIFLPVFFDKPMKPITPAIKDRILNYVIRIGQSHGKSEAWCRYMDIFSEIDIDPEVFDTVMKQFNTMGLIENYEDEFEGASFYVREEAHQYLLKGGFVEQGEPLESNISKQEYKEKLAALEESQKSLTSPKSIAKVLLLLAVVWWWLSGC